MLEREGKEKSETGKSKLLGFTPEDAMVYTQINALVDDFIQSQQRIMAINTIDKVTVVFPDAAAMPAWIDTHCAEMEEIITVLSTMNQYYLKRCDEAEKGIKLGEINQEGEKAAIAWNSIILNNIVRITEIDISKSIQHLLSYLKGDQKERLLLEILEKSHFLWKKFQQLQQLEIKILGELLKREGTTLSMMHKAFNLLKVSQEYIAKSDPLGATVHLKPILAALFEHPKSKEIRREFPKLFLTDPELVRSPLVKDRLTALGLPVSNLSRRIRIHADGEMSAKIDAAMVDRIIFTAVIDVNLFPLRKLCANYQELADVTTFKLVQRVWGAEKSEDIENTLDQFKQEVARKIQLLAAVAEIIGERNLLDGQMQAIKEANQAMRRLLAQLENNLKNSSQIILTPEEQARKDKVIFVSGKPEVKVKSEMNGFWAKFFPEKAIALPPLPPTPLTPSSPVVSDNSTPEEQILGMGHR